MKVNKKINKVLAIMIIISITVPTVFIFSKIDTMRKETINLTEDDNKVAAEISNMTGITSNEILKLKSQSKTWNEVLDLLKNKTTDGNQLDRENRLTLLSKNGLQEDIAAKLKSEGYSDTDITQAKMLVERVIFQLKEITAGEEEKSLLPELGTSKEATEKSPIAGLDALKSEDEKKSKTEDTSAYSELQGKLDIDQAVYLILKLKDEFGSMEKVLDEYLYSLQIGVNLDLYLTDKKAYEKEKQEKSIGTDQQKIITLAKIEAKMLEKIQSQNSKAVNQDKMAGKTEDKSGNIPGVKGDDSLPKPPLPELGNARPKDPREDVMKEIEGIKNRSLN